MYKFNGIKMLDIELSSNCQASCPMCVRNYHGGMENPLLEIDDINLDKFKKICPDYFIKQLETIVMCGNLGDPLLNNDLIPIVKYINDTNPNIRLDIHTNGSLRSTTWWKNLAEALPANHLLQFGIDGLEDTHSLYRIGTDFNIIIRNAKTFIEAGGRARWNFITFKHNEHQLDQARALSQEVGFESFQEKQTSRFIGNPWFDVLDCNGNVTHRLEQPTEQKLVFIDKETVGRYQELMKLATVSCQAEEQSSIFIDAKGYVWPCCFVGATPYIHATPEQLVYNYRNDSQASLARVLEQFRGKEQFNLENHSIQDIVESNEWQTIWNNAFIGDDKLHVCARACGKFPEAIVSQCRDQFLDLDNFNE